MYKKVLLATDGSATSLKATRVANNFLEKGIAEEITILYVAMGRDITNNYLGSDVSEKLIIASRENGEMVLKEARELFSDQGKVKTVIKSGDPAENIVTTAKDCDIIIVGSRGMNPMAGLLIGSVSSRVIQYADRPVLIVK